MANKFDTINAGTATGATGAFQVFVDGPGYYDGQRFSFVANNGVTGAVTFQVKEKAAKAIKKLGETAIATGDIIAGQRVEVVFDETNDYFQMTSQIAVAVVTGPTGAVVTGPTGAEVTGPIGPTGPSTVTIGATGATGAETQSVQIIVDGVTLVVNRIV